MSVKLNFGNVRHPGPNDRERDRTKISIDWDQITERYHARIREEVARGLNPPELQELPEYREVKDEPDVFQRKAKGSRKKDGPGPGRGWSRRYDHDEFVRLYTEENWSGNDIAKKFGCNSATVYLVLKKRGVTKEYNGGANAHKRERRAVDDQPAGA